MHALVHELGVRWHDRGYAFALSCEPSYKRSKPSPTSAEEVRDLSGPLWDISVPAGKAQDTLKLFIEQTNTPMLYRSDYIQDVPTHAIYGRLNAEDALIILLRGTALEPRFHLHHAAFVGPRAQEK